MSAVSAVRRGRLVLIGATVLGLWFGLTAPAVSPILPDGTGAAQFVDVSNDLGNDVGNDLGNDSDDGDDSDGRGGDSGRGRR